MTNLTEQLIRWESGEMDCEEEEVELFQHLVNTGLAWQLQGTYGRVAMSLIEEGLVTIPSEAPESPSEPLKAEGGPNTRRKGGRRSKKQIGALIKMANRKVPGFGIILDRVELKERDSETIRKIKKKGPIHWGVAGNDRHKNLILIEWFEPPSEYNDVGVKTVRQWYPDKWVKVVSPAPQTKESKDEA